jgi:hypothetical protein
LPGPAIGLLRSPSVRGTFETSRDVRSAVAIGGKADIARQDPKDPGGLKKCKAVALSHPMQARQIHVARGGRSTFALARGSLLIDPSRDISQAQCY